MRDSLSPSTYSSSESAASNMSKTRGAGGINKAVMAVLEEIGIGNGETTRYMKERNDYNEVMIQQNSKMLKMADKKHVVRRVMDLSKLLLMPKQSLQDAQQELKRLQTLQDYDTDSSEKRAAKYYVHVLSNRYSNTIQQLKNHDIQRDMIYAAFLSHYFTTTSTLFALKSCISIVKIKYIKFSS
jgi:hypothetical protein